MKCQTCQDCEYYPCYFWEDIDSAIWKNKDDFDYDLSILLVKHCTDFEEKEDE